MSQQSQAEEVAHWRQILQQQAHIALINYDAAQSNHTSLQKLFEIVVEQSSQIEALVGAVAELLEALENR